MIRRIVLLSLFLTVSVSAQSPAPVTVPKQGDWVGPLEFTDSRGRMIIPTRVSLTLTEDKKLTGRWHALTKHSSGTLTGTIDGKSNVRLTVTLYAGAEESGLTIATERCGGEAEFTGTILPGGVWRLVAKRVVLDTPLKRLQERNCEDITKLIWTLQPRD